MGRPVNVHPPGADRGVKQIRKFPGLARRIAERLGISRMAVYQWKVVPLGRVLDVHRITKDLGVEIALWQLRPDAFPRPRDAKGQFLAD